MSNEELKKRINYLENENIFMYAALVEASNLSGVGALRCKVELQRIARNDAAAGDSAFKFDLTYEEVSTGRQITLTIHADRLDIAKSEAGKQLGDGYKYIRSRGVAW